MLWIVTQYYHKLKKISNKYLTKKFDYHIIRDIETSGGIFINMKNANILYSENKDYDNINDEDLIEYIKSGDKYAFEYLLNKYRELVNIKVSKYYIVGAEKDDIVQEGLIGLFKAIKSYKSDMQNSFKSFANMCIERQLITAIKTSNRQKHIPLNSYLSLNTSAYNEEEGECDTDLIDIFDSNLVEDPLDTITKKEYYQNLEDAIDKSLSDFEKKVLNKYINGKSYVQIATDLDTPVKSIDNAIQRIRKKAIKSLKKE